MLPAVNKCLAFDCCACPPVGFSYLISLNNDTNLTTDLDEYVSDVAQLIVAAKV